MKSKKRAFTLLELIITLALTSLILGVIYTFFITNNKSLSRIEINSELQTEASSIQTEILTYLTQSEGISEINNMKIDDNNKVSYDENLDSDSGKLDIENLKVKIENEYYEFKFDESTSMLSLKAIDKNGNVINKNNLPKILSKNVKEFQIRPLDFRSNPDGNFKDTYGVEVLLTLKKKKGYSDVETPFSLIVKFRNKK